MEERGTRGEERGGGGAGLNVGVQADLLRREQAEHVRRTLAEMPSDYAWLLVAKYVDDRPIAAISAELAAGAEAVRSKLARARRLFRTALSRRGLAPTLSGKIHDE